MESPTEHYQPGTDQNQGVLGEMARNEQASTLDPATVGVSQEPQFDPNVFTNTEAANHAMARQELGADADNDDVSGEEAVEDGDVTIEGTDEEQASFDGPDF